MDRLKEIVTLLTVIAMIVFCWLVGRQVLGISH